MVRLAVRGDDPSAPPPSRIIGVYGRRHERSPEDEEDDAKEKTPSPTDAPTTGNLSVGLNNLPEVTAGVNLTPGIETTSEEAKFNSGTGTLAVEGFELTTGSGSTMKM